MISAGRRNYGPSFGAAYFFAKSCRDRDIGAKLAKAPHSTRISDTGHFRLLIALCKARAKRVHRAKLLMSNCKPTCPPMRLFNRVCARAIDDRSWDASYRTARIYGSIGCAGR